MKPQNIQAYPAFTWLLLAAMLGFALNSYPMLYPWYDFHFHLETIKNNAQHANSFWHFLWAQVFAALNTPDEQTVRALIIHRTQTLMTLGLLLASAYLFLGAAFQRLGNHTKIQLAATAVLFWLVMHGTYSSPPGQRHILHVMSWLQWYSVNYQIALPMFVFGSATLLKAVTSTGLKHTVFWSVMTLTMAYLIARIHAAELVYFLFVAGGVFLFYVLPGKSWRVVLLVVAILYVCLQLGLKYTYRQPLILELLHPYRWAELVQLAGEFGHSLVVRGLNRAATSWHSLYTVSLLAGVAALVLAKDKATVRVAMLLLFSSLLAVGLHIQFFAGLLGLVIGQFVTWRFGFSTLLFLGIPLLVGVWLERRLQTDSPLRTSMFALGVPTGLLVLVLLYSRFFERLQPPYNFAKSLLFSLDPVLGHFPINP